MRAMPMRQIMLPMPVRAATADTGACCCFDAAPYRFALF